ncbi:hypothetical protein CONPUDRAFT_139047 [Coniophora puteana RWD-64-598 SS2]|uniref:Glycosyl transferase family 25 domain-containing protein n=1 Tax=Coniophora puteana (strain RWD-64-598) TaxID=741705 RepID=A0A5M3MFB7_CONPW|nr:uncharacterized protein CONPUDRAFT_139047 [Coniophora puteana RWD-64-598 SS2]EIW77938.1 hypothetical protein CONPUDRAFT_139047 [Coniophora puteana RWD-64-598 SS2]
MLASILPSDQLAHSRTLFPLSSPSDTAEIYAISLARRQDRRHVLNQIASALELDFTFIDATDASLPIIDTLLERVTWQRWARIDETDISAAESIPEDFDETSSDTYVAHAFPFAWSEEALSVIALDANITGPQPALYAGADYWDMSPPDAQQWAQNHPISSPPASGPSWRTSVHSASALNNIRKEEVMRRAAVACWHSHYQAIRDIVEKDHAFGLILEDDIDIDFNIEHTLLPQLPHLPPDWDILFLGHCHSSEHHNPPLPRAPRFRQTYHALCLHGYALSRKGARRLLTLLRSADYAYSRPVDHAVKDLVQMHMMQSYSAYPPLVVQRKEDRSDIVGAVPEDFAREWKAVEGDLADSTVERIRAYEEMEGVE